MNDMTAVKRAVDRLLAGDLEPLLHLLAEDVVFEAAIGGDMSISLEDSGKQPVVDYFKALGGIVAFWQMDYSPRGDHLIAWGKESFTVENCGIQGGSEFALVFELRDGLITRFLVVEDLRSFIRDSGPLVSAPSRRPRYRMFERSVS
jgi:ketosteroid isomerase-like protein